MTFLRKYALHLKRKTNSKVFNMITNKYYVETMVKHVSCDCKCKVSSTISNSNQKLNNNKCQCECKKYHICKINCICMNNNHLKHIVNDCVMCFVMLYVMDIKSTDMTNTIPTNMKNTISKNVSTSSDG